MNRHDFLIVYLGQQFFWSNCWSMVVVMWPVCAIETTSSAVSIFLQIKNLLNGSSIRIELGNGTENRKAIVEVYVDGVFKQYALELSWVLMSSDKIHHVLLYLFIHRSNWWRGYRIIWVIILLLGLNLQMWFFVLGYVAQVVIYHYWYPIWCFFLLLWAWFWNKNDLSI